jgi:hypothetical protein
VFSLPKIEQNWSFWGVFGGFFDDFLEVLRGKLKIIHKKKSRFQHLRRLFLRYSQQIFDYLPKFASKAIAEGLKSIDLTNRHDSIAPCSRSIALSSHSTDRGPL